MVSDEEADVVVIGSGMGGLSAARAIAQFGGRRVLVLEQHYTLGGMTHEFSRAGRYRFGTGLHYMSASAGPFLGFMTDGRAQLSPLPDEYDALHFPGFDFSVPATKERFRERLKERFPAEADAIDGFFRTTRWAMAGLAARNVFASFPAGKAGAFIVERLFPSTYRSLRDQVSRSFRDPQLRAVLAARWGLYGTPPESSAFGYHAAVPLTFFMEGTAHPVGGPQELNRVVLEILQRYGVVLRSRQTVREVVVEGGKVTGVDVQDTATGLRYRVRTDTVVSAAGVRNTYALIGKSHELEDLPEERSAVMLFLGLDRSPAEFGLRGENHWLMPDLDEHDSILRPPGEGTLYVSFASLNNPAARFHTVEVLELVDPKVVEQWRGTPENERPAGYRKFKDELTERMLARLEERWPGFRETIAFAELGTPLSFETYQHSVLGSFYGRLGVGFRQFLAQHVGPLGQLHPPLDRPRQHVHPVPPSCRGGYEAPPANRPGTREVPRGRRSPATDQPSEQHEHTTLRPHQRPGLRIQDENASVSVPRSAPPRRLHTAMRGPDTAVLAHRGDQQPGSGNSAGQRHRLRWGDQSGAQLPQYGRDGR
ncbi:phytoene desaturase family protein [Streptomyces acidicola]|uniref:phytoene desaturase family protein n=1 Tax=Streptomyces acidicola TaxID=2596892 RepID=UPI003444155E